MNFGAIRWRRIPTEQVAENEVYQMQNGEDWICSAEGFNGQGIVAVMQVHCLSPAIPVQAYGCTPIGKDFRDMELLQERFGVECSAGCGLGLDRDALGLRSWALHRLLQDNATGISSFPSIPRKWSG